MTPSRSRPDDDLGFCRREFAINAAWCLAAAIAADLNVLGGLIHEYRRAA